VPKDLADLIERGAMAKHVGCETVPQEVCTFARRYDTGIPQRTEHDLRNRVGPGEATMRRATPDEDGARAALGTILS
jgi:hypothetical protein